MTVGTLERLRTPQLFSSWAWIPQTFSSQHVRTGIVLGRHQSSVHITRQKKVGPDVSRWPPQWQQSGCTHQPGAKTGGLVNFSADLLVSEPLPKGASHTAGRFFSFSVNLSRKCPKTCLLVGSISNQIEHQDEPAHLAFL